MKRDWSSFIPFLFSHRFLLFLPHFLQFSCEFWSLIVTIHWYLPLSRKSKTGGKKKKKKTHGGMEPSPRNPHVVCFVRHLRHHLASVLVISRSRVCEKLASHDQATGWQTARRIGTTSVGRPACRPAVTTQHVQQTATGDIRRVWKCAVSRRHCLKWSHVTTLWPVRPTVVSGVGGCQGRVHGGPLPLLWYLRQLMRQTINNL